MLQTINGIILIQCNLQINDFTRYKTLNRSALSTHFKTEMLNRYESLEMKLLFNGIIQKDES